MQRLGLLLILVIPFFTTGCKQEVGFGATQNSQQVGSSGNDDTVQGPVVKITQEPSDHKLFKSTQVVFEVIAGDNEIEKVQCFINDFEINCDWVKGIVKLFDMPLGVHWFEVVATDVEGLVGKAKENWSVFNNYVRHKEGITVDKESKKTDILFVIDNSSSMRYEQTQISERFNNFINQIDDIDWHIAITTTDPRSSLDWNDGKIDPFSNRDYYLTPALGKKTAQELFSEHVQRRESGWDTEKGINATYRAIERGLDGRGMVNKKMAEFFRDDAALAVVVLSDEDEAGSGGKSDVNNLLNLVKNSWGNSKVFQFNSIIVHTQECLNASWQHRLGHKYEELSRRTNGLLGDLCAKNYSKMLTDLGKGVANLKRVHKLKCEPQDIDNDNKVDLVIIPKNGKKLPGYTIDKETITFDKALKSGDYDFHYFCLEN